MGLDEVGTVRTLREHRKVTNALVKKHGGRDTYQFSPEQQQVALGQDFVVWQENSKIGVPINRGPVFHDGAPVPYRAPRRSSMFFTLIACQAPRAVAIPGAFRASATARVFAPARCASLIIGRTFAAC